VQDKIFKPTQLETMKKEGAFETCDERCLPH
jgi:hypothetical protein